MTQYKIGIPKEEYDDLVAEAIKAGLRSPQDNGEKGLAPILRQRLAAAHAPQTAQAQAVPEELPPVLLPAHKRVRIWYAVSSKNAIRYEGHLLCVDETFVTAQIDDEIKLFHKQSILGPILVAEEEAG